MGRPEYFEAFFLRQICYTNSAVSLAEAPMTMGRTHQCVHSDEISHSVDSLLMHLSVGAPQIIAFTTIRLIFHSALLGRSRCFPQAGIPFRKRLDIQQTISTHYSSIPAKCNVYDGLTFGGGVLLLKARMDRSTLPAARCYFFCFDQLLVVVYP